MQDMNAYEFSGKVASELRKRVFPSVTEMGLRGQDWRTDPSPCQSSSLQWRETSILFWATSFSGHLCHFCLDLWIKHFSHTQSHYITQAHIKYSLPASASLVLGWQACATRPDLYNPPHKRFSVIPEPCASLFLLPVILMRIFCIG